MFKDMKKPHIQELRVFPLMISQQGKLHSGVTTFWTREWDLQDDTSTNQRRAGGRLVGGSLGLSLSFENSHFNSLLRSFRPPSPHPQNQRTQTLFFITLNKTKTLFFFSFYLHSSYHCRFFLMPKPLPFFFFLPTPGSSFCIPFIAVERHVKAN